MRRSAWTIGATVLAALSLGVAACGGSDNNSSSDSGKTSTGTKLPDKPKTGGKLTVLWTGDVDHIDCGQTYYQMGNFICNATQKNLYNYEADDAAKMVPDLADGDPQVSEDGKTVTVKIKPGVKYSPPYEANTVTSKDGTTIAFETVGKGPPLVIVGGALSDRNGAATQASFSTSSMYL